MASEKDTNIYILGQVKKVKAKSFEKLSPEDFGVLSQGLKVFLSYAVKPITSFNLDPSFTEEKNPQEQVRLFHSGLIPLNVIDEIIAFLSKSPETKPEEKKRQEEKKEEDKEPESQAEEEEQKPKPSEKPETPKITPSPHKEVSTVSPLLDELVKRHQEVLADKLEEDSKHSVANAVLRARKTWEAKNKIDTILKNRTEIEKEEEDRLFVEIVDPKSESRESIYRNVSSVARQAVIAQAANLSLGISSSQIEKAVEDLTYLGISGAVDMTNFHDLNVVSQLAFRNQGIDITSPVNNVDNVVQAWQQASEIEPYSNKIDDLEKEISSADESSQQYFKTSTKTFQTRLKQNNLDLDDDLRAAEIETENVQKALEKAIAYTTEKKTDVTEKQSAELEKVLRLSDSTLQINPEGTGARVVAVLQTTNASNRNISPEVVRLYSVGLTPDKLAKIENLAKEKPDSELGKYYRENNDVFDKVRFQIGKLHKSELGKQIQDGIKPVSGISAQVTGIYNKMSPATQTATKLIFNPRGTIYAWANKKIGEHIGKTLVKNAGSATVQKIGNFILNEGLQKGVSSFAKATAEKLALEVAKKVGIAVVGDSLVGTVALALGIPTGGASILIGIVIIIATEVVKATFGKVKKGLDSVWRQLGWGDEFKARDMAAPVVALGGIAATAAALSFARFIAIRRATQIAIISAAGIIIFATAITTFYVAFAYLVAPILSTLVQLDSLEKVDYSEYQIASSSSDCGWPTGGHYMVQSGPGGGTHSLSNLQAIDIFSPGSIGGTPTISSTDGTVSLAGSYSNYGDTIIIDTTNSAGSFKAIYAHMASMSVSPGQKVQQGQKIGTVGSTSLFPNPHIHFELKGIPYNKCPAGGRPIPEKCVGFVACGSVYTN